MAQATNPMLDNISVLLEEAIAAQNIPGASIAVLCDGSLYEAAAGFANVPAGIEADTNTIFQIGSTTKTFNATLLMKLHEQGLVNIDAPTSRYLPDLKIEGAPVPDTLTLRTLLNYTAGMEGDYFDDFGPGLDSLQRYVESTGKLRWIHQPGKMRAYNSTSHCIAGRVAEVVTGQSYSAALADIVLKPLGLEHFAFYTEDIARFRTAVGHRFNPETQTFEIPERLRMPFNLGPAGSTLSMTARDLVTFARLYLDRGVSQSGKQFLQPTYIDEIIQPSELLPPNDTEIMMGWASFPSNHGRLIAASGQTYDHNSFLVFLPEKQFAISVLANSENGAQSLFLTLGLEIMKACADITIDLPAQQTPQVSPDDFKIDKAAAAPYVGEFFNGVTFEVESTGDGMTLTVIPDSSSGGEDSKQVFALAKAEDNKFVGAMDPTGQPLFVVEYVFEDPTDAIPSHIFWANRLLVRTAR